MGESEFVIAVNIDVRGFSAFSKKVESPNSAMFIKRVYMRLIDEYFEDASFFKPTGDGLLLTIPFEEGNLQKVLRGTVQKCLKAVKDFPKFCTGDSMINFAVPENIGIGIARDTACRLVAKGKVLDYSGRVLNLASRLMDLARPGGVVLDGGVGFELLTPTIKKQFKSKSIFVKSVAERLPMKVFYTSERTVIPQRNLFPLDKPKWHVQLYKKTLRQIKEINTTRFQYDLAYEPIDPTRITVEVHYQAVKEGRRTPGILTYSKLGFKYELDAGRPFVVVNFVDLKQRLVRLQIKDSWEVKIKVAYEIG